MSDQELHLHYVCTYDETNDLIAGREKFWVMDCRCRKSKENCFRSQMDVCLQLKKVPGANRELSFSEAQDLLKTARLKHLVARPFRGENDKSSVEGICFCCDDCCAYFLHPREKCNQGSRIEKTDMKVCNHCGACTMVCYFGARKISREKVVLERGACFGCGLCADVCPLNCIEMEKRK